MKLTEQARQCTRMKKEVDVGSDAYVAKNFLRTINCAEVQVLEPSDRGGRPLLSLLTLILLIPY